MSEDVTIKMLEAYIKTFEKWNDLYPITPQLIETLKSTLEIIEKQQKEIKDLKKYKQYYENSKVVWNRNNYISKDKIRSLLKQVNSSLYHFKDSEKNNIIQRLKDRLEQLLEEKYYECL